MPKTVQVTVELTFPVDVPDSWVKQETYWDKIQEQLNIAVTAGNKQKVDVGDVEIEFTEMEPEE